MITTATSDVQIDIVPLLHRIGDGLSTFMRRNGLVDQDSAKPKWALAKQSAFANARQASPDMKIVAGKERVTMVKGKLAYQLILTHQRRATNADKDLAHEYLENTTSQSEKRLAAIANAIAELE